MSRGATTGYRVHTVRTQQELESLREPWRDLYANSDNATPPLLFEWQTEWWRIYGPSYATPDGLRVVTVWRHDQLVGLLPLYLSLTRSRLAPARLQFLSTGEDESEETCPDYMDLLAWRGEEEPVARSVIDALTIGGLGHWDDIVLTDVSTDSVLARSWPRSWSNRWKSSVDARGKCPTADLQGGFDAYLGRLSGNSRQQCRRILREAERAGAELQVATSEYDACEYFENLVTLHQDRWTSAGRPGCFSAPKFTEFHRTLARRLYGQPELVLARMTVDGVPIAVLYGFVARHKFDFYQSGVRLDGKLRLSRPGITAHLMLMSHLAGLGVTKYDFLRGSAEYKQRLSTGATTMTRLRVARPSLRSVVREVAHSCRRIRHWLKGKVTNRFASLLASLAWQSALIMSGAA